MEPPQHHPEQEIHQTTIANRVDASPSTLGQQTTRPLNILRIATDLYPDITGGGPIHAHAMSKQQSEWGHNVVVLTSDHGEQHNPSVSTDEDYTIIRHRELARPLDNSIIPGLIKTLRDRLEWADVVHAHSHLYFSTNLAAAVRRVSDTPLIVTNHGLISQTAPLWVQKLFIPTVAKFTFNSADRILCYTETDKQLLQDRNVTAPIEVITNGIDCDQFTPGRGDSGKELLFVGRLKDGKGVPTLLETFARLVSAYPDLTLRIVGDGPERTRYENRCVELGIEDRVEFVGDVSYEDMPEQYQRSTIFILPSLNEGLPRTVLEAMSCEVPVVTSDLDQLESIVPGAGYTAPCQSVPDFVDAISRLLDDEDERSRLGAHGRQRVLEMYSWERTVERTTELYYELVD